MSQTDQCCPVFDPKPFENQTLQWENKLFVKDTMRTFMHMPLFGVFGKTITRMMKTIDEQQALPPESEILMLSTDPSPWKSELYIHVTKEIKGGENMRLSGTYLTKVYDGPYSEIRKWVGDLQAHAKNSQKKLKRMFFYYTTCPKCAKKHGHNYVVGFAEV